MRKSLRDCAPISATIHTGGADHRISWRAGRLCLHDHDVDAEEVLVALGGEPCVCLLVRDVFRGLYTQTPVDGGWSARSVAANFRYSGQSGGLLVRAASMKIVGATSAGGGATRTTRTRQVLQALQNDPAFQGMPGQHRERLLAQLRHQVVMEIVPGPMAELLKDIAQIRWRRRTERAPLEAPRRTPAAVLRGALEPVVREAVRSSRAHLRAYGELTVECWRQAPGKHAEIDGHIGKFGGFVSVSVGLSWLNRVWVRGLASVDGHLILEVDAPAPARILRGVAVRWERRALGDSVPVLASCLLLKPSDEWRLSWL
jgi:hypothetical protein